MTTSPRIGPVQIRVPAPQLAEWKRIHRVTYQDHGLSFTTWLRDIIEQYVQAEQEVLERQTVTA